MSHFAGTGDPVLIDHGASTPQHLATQAAVAVDRCNAAAGRLAKLHALAEHVIGDVDMLRGMCHDSVTRATDGLASADLARYCVELIDTSPAGHVLSRVEVLEMLALIASPPTDHEAAKLLALHITNQHLDLPQPEDGHEWDHSECCEGCRSQ